MEKANRVRKIVTRTAAGVLFVTLLIFNLQIGVFGSGNSQLSLSTLAFGMFTPAAGEGGGCSDGGVYTLSCYNAYDGCSWWWPRDCVFRTICTSCTSVHVSSYSDPEECKKCAQ
jgi:hypothetical protein